MSETGLFSHKCLSGSALKLLAVVSMLIDHTASVLLSRSPLMLLDFWRIHLRLYTVMRFVGRLAFPIFCFLLVEGFLHSRNRRRYALRLLLFALLSELPWNLCFGGALRYNRQNVYFTLLLGFLGLIALERLEQNTGRREHNALALLALTLLSFFFKADYGATGFGLILCLYLLRERPLPQAVLGSCILTNGWKAGLAFIPINFYNGQRGFVHSKVLQWAFYAFYPLHLTVLYLIRKSTLGI